MNDAGLIRDFNLDYWRKVSMNTFQNIYTGGNCNPNEMQHQGRGFNPFTKMVDMFVSGKAQTGYFPDFPINLAPVLLVKLWKGSDDRLRLPRN